MSKQIRSKNEQKRQQILDSATKLFTENGYSSTSMDQIAKGADVSKQTVYSHFGNKEDLFAASIKLKCDSYQMSGFSEEELTDARKTLLDIAHKFYAMVTSKEALAVYKTCSYESKTHPELAELFIKEGPERVTKEVAALFSRLSQQGLLSIDNPYFAAQQFLHAIKGESWMRMKFNTEKQTSAEEISDYIVSCVELFLRGYAKH